PFQTQNVLAAAAAAWALNVPCEAIRAALESFVGDAEQAPARFNVFEHNGATIVFDDAHNSSALAALIEALGEVPHQKRSIVYAVEGDRRDLDAVRQGEQLGAAFDRVILYESDAHSGRAEGEMTTLLRRGLEGATRAPEVLQIASPCAATTRALQS